MSKNPTIGTRAWRIGGERRIGVYNNHLREDGSLLDFKLSRPWIVCAADMHDAKFATHAEAIAHADCIARATKGGL